MYKYIFPTERTVLSRFSKEFLSQKKKKIGDHCSKLYLEQYIFTLEKVTRQLFAYKRNLSSFIKHLFQTSRDAACINLQVDSLSVYKSFLKGCLFFSQSIIISTRILVAVFSFFSFSSQTKNSALNTLVTLQLTIFSSPPQSISLRGSKKCLIKIKGTSKYKYRY